MLKSVLSLLKFNTRNSALPLTRQKMERLCVRSIEGDERIQISLLYKLEEKQIVKPVNVDRPKSEELSKTLERLGINLTKRLFSKKKLQELPTNNITTMSLTEPNVGKVDENILNSQAWSKGSILGIKLLDNSYSEYEVVLNPPTITSLKLPNCLLAGFSVRPEVHGEFIDLEECVFKWYRVSSVTEYPTHNEDAVAGQKQANKKRRTSVNQERIEVIADGPLYLIQNKDVGSKLKLVCVPSNGEVSGMEAEVISKSEVIGCPGHIPFEERHLLTKTFTPDDSLRVVSYNILADVYADSDFSREMLFPYCPTHALAMDYRRNLLEKEILGYNADIVCLQEVDSKVFMRYLLPAFKDHGYEGVLKLKSGEVREGTATFIRTEKFRIIEQHDISLREQLQNNKIYEEVQRKIAENENMKSKMDDRTTMLQVTVLEDVKKPSKYIILGNTHLFFHPNAGNVRLIQTYVCMQHLSHVKSLYQQQGKDVSVVFCGDLNSFPLSGAVELITKGSVASHHSDWYSGGKPLLLEDMQLRHELMLTSACGFPEYTNYKSGFHGCLDYIFVEPSVFSVQTVFPLPSHEEVTQFTAIPNPVFPSDHLALVCDLQYVKTLNDTA